jgi:hypothetical protein
VLVDVDERNNEGVGDDVLDIEKIVTLTQSFHSHIPFTFFHFRYITFPSLIVRLGDYTHNILSLP